MRTYEEIRRDLIENGREFKDRDGNAWNIKSVMDVDRYVFEIGVKEAWNEAIEAAAESADIKMKKKSHYGKYRKWQNVKENEVDLFNYEIMYSVDKQSILKLKL